MQLVPFLKYNVAITYKRIGLQQALLETICIASDNEQASVRNPHELF